MSETAVVIAPHPDDETLGCGGALLKHAANGDQIHWVIMTTMTLDTGYSEEEIKQRQGVIEKVTQKYNFTSCEKLGLPTTQLDCLPMSDMTRDLRKVIDLIQPTVMYLPYPGDVHSDHRVSFNAATSVTKWFRFPSIKRILCYEVLSETDYAINPTQNHFQPTVFINVDDHWQQKVAIAECYRSELKDFPFPRSIEAMTALAKLRGSQAGCHYAEGFMLLKEIVT